MVDHAAKLDGVFGRGVKRLREEQGLKQETLAELVGYASHSPIAQIERGRQLPSLEKAFELARILGVPLEAFVNEGYTPPLAETYRETVATPPETRRQFVRYIDALAADIQRLTDGGV